MPTNQKKYLKINYLYSKNFDEIYLKQKRVFFIPSNKKNCQLEETLYILWIS